jgi:hypothetical protein
MKFTLPLLATSTLPKLQITGYPWEYTPNMYVLWASYGQVMGKLFIRGLKRRR